MPPTRAVPRAYLVLTGHCEGRRHRIIIGDESLWLARSLFRAFCELIAERLTAPDRFVSLREGDVCALRRVLKRTTTNWQTSPLAISTGTGTTYALLGDPEVLAVDATFAALAKGRTLPPRLVECISRHCRLAE